jgi:hypothetical protein
MSSEVFASFLTQALINSHSSLGHLSLRGFGTRSTTISSSTTTANLQVVSVCVLPNNSPINCGLFVKICYCMVAAAVRSISTVK